MNIVLVGAGGTGISSLAYIFKILGYSNIVCIDSTESQITKKLKFDGFNVLIGHGKYDIQKQDLVIYSDATINSPEVKKSFEYANQKLKNFHYPFSYHAFLGEISKYFQTIAVAGTHGKSTTTAMTINTLKNLTNDLAIGVVGALIPQLDGKNYYVNVSLKEQIKTIFDHIITGKYKDFDHSLVKKYYFVVEADEFNRHFLYYDTDYTIILNMQLDHSDVYTTYKSYIEAFQKLCEKTRSKIFASRKTTEIGLLNVQSGKIKLCNYKKFNFKYIFGDHNIHNASLVYHLIKTLFPKLYSKDIINNLENFKGVWRRMEFLFDISKINPNIGKSNQMPVVYTDYGHHPDELEAVYNAFKKRFPKNRLVAVFQPHQARRVLEFWDKFINVLKKFDKVIIYDIYTAREDLNELKKIFSNKDFSNVYTVDMLGELFASKVNGTYTKDFQYIVDVLKNLSFGDIAICFSAGDLDYKLRLVV